MVQRISNIISGLHQQIGLQFLKNVLNPLMYQKLIRIISKNMMKNQWIMRHLNFIQANLTVFNKQIYLSVQIIFFFAKLYSVNVANAFETNQWTKKVKALTTFFLKFFLLYALLKKYQTQSISKCDGKFLYIYHS